MQSDKLDPSVPSDLEKDIVEAERAHYSQCYKACVAMCRRALQLSLIEHGIDDKRLSVMLEEARTVKKLLADDTFHLTTSLEGFGDNGVHEKDQLESDEVELVTNCTVRILNELYSSD